MTSAPPPTATSQSPSNIACAAETMACKPEPHNRLTVSAGTEGWAVRPLELRSGPGTHRVARLG